MEAERKTMTLTYWRTINERRETRERELLIVFIEINDRVWVVDTRIGGTFDTLHK